MKLFQQLFRRRKNLAATRYDAAMTTAENRRHWSFADTLSPDRSMTPQVRQTLRDRARYESANNAYARGIVLAIAEDMIGTGPRARIVLDSESVRNEVERAFLHWTKEVQLAEKLRTMCQAKIVDGEAFALLINNPALRSEVKLDLRLLEAERFAAGWNDLYATNESDGILFDAYDNPAAYRVLKEHPGSGLVRWNESETLPASSVIHWFRRDRPEQHRGLSELTPALPLFAQLRRYTLAVLASAETAADFAAVIYTDTPSGGEAIAAAPFETVSLERRMATTLPDGWKLGQVKAEQPVTNYPEFKREILGEIGRALLIPINIVTGDSSQHGYASGRLDYQAYHRMIRVEQSLCASAVLNRVLNAWYEEYRLIHSPSELGNGGGEVLPKECSASWFWDGFEHVDPNKEATAQRRRLGSRTSTLADEYARVGKDWEEEIRQVARERKLMTELGLIQKK